jgi:hypothetical protein
VNRAHLAALLFALPTPVLAAAPKDSISDELGLGAAQTASHNPRTGQVTDTLSASVDVGRGWSFDLVAGLTLIGAIKGNRQAFADSGGNTVFFSPGVTYEASEHVLVGLALTFSPSSRVLADTTVPFTGPLGKTTDADAQLSATTSSSGVRLSLSYDTARESDYETGLDFDVVANRFDTDQHIEKLRGPAGGVIDLQTFCATHFCDGQLQGLLQQRPATLTQAEVRIGVTETLFRDTDVGLAGSYFFYNRDPTEVGFFDLMVTGRGGSFGSGVPLAPMRWSLRPEVTQRFGSFSARLWLENGRYVDNEGTTNVLGVKLQYKFSQGFRMWITGTWQRDKDAEDNVSTFSQAALGAMWLF